MTVSPAIAEKVAILANTPDELLPGFSPLEQAAIIALKAMMKNGKAAGAGTPAAKQIEHQNDGEALLHVRFNPSG